MKNFVRLTIVVGTFLATCLVIAAQEGPKEDIVRFNQRISLEPTNASLFLSRGDLHRAVGHWDAAQADYDYALSLDPKLYTVDFLRGRLYLEVNWPISAKVALDRFLIRQPEHLEALVTRARTLVKLEDRVAAGRDYTRAIELSTQSRPDLYIERAQALAAAGGLYVKEALRGLDEGIKKLGSIPTLQLAAIEIEMKQNGYDAALARLDTIAEGSQRKESWLVRKGEILQQAGRKAEARAAYQAALDAIQTLPPARRNVPATLDLQQRAREHLEALK